MNRMALLCILTPLLLTLGSCKESKDVAFRGIRDFRFEKNDGSAGLRMNVILFNPNTFGFRISHTQAEIFINDRSFGRAVQTAEVRLAPGAETPVSCELKVAPGDVLRLLPSGVQAFFGGAPLRVVTRGSVVVSKAFLSKKIQFESKETLDSKLLREWL